MGEAAQTEELQPVQDSLCQRHQASLAASAGVSYRAEVKKKEQIKMRSNPAVLYAQIHRLASLISL